MSTSSGSPTPNIVGEPGGSGPLPLPPMPRPRRAAARAAALGDADNMPTYLHSYSNISATTCGQAAIATLADYLGRDIPGLQRTVTDSNDGLMHWDDEAAVTAVNAQFPPDVVGGLCGTSGGRIQAALQAYGLEATFVMYSGVTTPWEQLWSTLQQWVNAGWPAAVLLQADLIPGYSGFLNVSGHWPILFRLDDEGAHLANCGGSTLVIPVDAFLTAWNYLAFNPAAYGYNHCAVVPYTARTS